MADLEKELKKADRLYKYISSIYTSRRLAEQGELSIQSETSEDLKQYVLDSIDTDHDEKITTEELEKFTMGLLESKDDNMSALNQVLIDFKIKNRDLSLELFKLKNLNNEVVYKYRELVNENTSLTLQNVDLRTDLRDLKGNYTYKLQCSMNTVIIIGSVFSSLLLVFGASMMKSTEYDEVIRPILIDVVSKPILYLPTAITMTVTLLTMCRVIW